MEKRSRQPPSESPEKFSGLHNQGATCYLNTLLQTLYMTPEVKEAIIRFVETTDGKFIEDSSICYQLKVLFAELDANHTANTHGITRNLGMKEQDVFKQQDIEEYFRWLLNEVDRESDGSCKILQIYQSKVINSLECLKCKIESPEECILLDIPLSIPPFEHSDHFSSVIKCLDAFLKETILNGDNLCYCETCGKKTETKTKYYFESLPKILALQLKRFEFDYTELRFTKLHDNVEIPLKLTFRKTIVAGKTEWQLTSVNSKEGETTDSKELEPQPLKRSKYEKLKNERQEESKEGERADSTEPETQTSEISRHADSEEIQKLPKLERQEESKEGETADSRKPGTQTLEISRNADSEETLKPAKDERQEDYTTFKLFAICDHSGGYGSGHYVAYIKPISSNNWYCFDDRNVCKMPDFILESSSDDANSPSSIPCIRSKTAYMLMYRKEEVNIYQGENTDEEKPMTMRKKNESLEFGRMEDGTGNHYLEQNNQPSNEMIKDPPENSAPLTKEPMGNIEKRKCEMMEKESQSQETDEKEDVQVFSTDTHEIVTPEKTHGEKCQRDGKENIMGKDDMQQLKVSEEKTVERILDMEKENRDEQLKEEFTESNVDEKNIKEANRIGVTSLCIERKKDERTIQEGNDATGLNKTELYQEEQKGMVQTSQHEGLQCVKRMEEIKHQGRKEPPGMEPNKHPSASEKKLIRNDKGSQEEELGSLLSGTKEEEGS
ncbi:ubiquitin carboxyl-terminal hydrolase 47-like isoform X3 [Mustelus asterias]